MGDTRADFNGEAYATVSGSELEQLGAGTKRVHRSRPQRRRLAADATAPRARSARPSRPAICGARWPRRPGPAPTPVSSSTRSSTSGTPHRPAERSEQPTPAPNTFFSTTPRAISRRSTSSSSTTTKPARFDTEGYEHAIRLWTITLEISVTMAHFPSREIAQGSYDYRTLGLGYANLGTLLMRMGLPYDSDAGRAVSGAITAILTGYAYATSAELAAAVGPFPRFAENREAMLRVIRNHRRAAYNTHQNEYEGLSHYRDGDQPRAHSEQTCSPLLARAGISPSTWASAMASATPRSVFSLRLERSGCRWIATPPGSSPTSPWSSSRSWPVAATSRSSISRWRRR